MLGYLGPRVSVIQAMRREFDYFNTKNYPSYICAMYTRPRDLAACTCMYTHCKVICYFSPNCPNNCPNTSTPIILPARLTLTLEPLTHRVHMLCLRQRLGLRARGNH